MRNRILCWCYVWGEEARWLGEKQSAYQTKSSYPSQKHHNTYTAVISVYFKKQGKHTFKQSNKVVHGREKKY